MGRDHDCDEMVPGVSYKDIPLVDVISRLSLFILYYDRFL